MDRNVIIGTGQGEITEKKSRFIANVFEIHSEDEAAGIIEGLKKKYWDARHNCYAYVLGPSGGLERFSDDGEPSGTAGRPILDVIKGAGVLNCLIVVTRYFGGILLGTGGLVRAYSDASHAGLESATVLPVLEGVKATFACDYKDIGAFEKLMATATVIRKEYGEKVTIELILENLSAFEKEALNITKGAFSFIESAPVSFCPGSGIYTF